tara:strand:- start:2802 stop:3866 length:1065 start_codon:yes stop_codon:yes gene_type:complete
MKDKKLKLTTLDVLNSINKALFNFIDMPSEENLSKFDKLCSLYKETWIEEASRNDVKASSGDLPIEKASSEIPYLESLPNYITEESDNSDKPERHASDIEEIKQEVYDKIWTKELARASSIDGSVKILTQSIKHPTNKAIIGSSEYDLKPIDFNQHAIRAIRPSENLDDKKFNRRWYFEKEGDSKIAWWCNRDQMISMIEDANKKGMLKSSLDNTRINNYKIIKSRDLDKASYDEYLKSFTLFEERDGIFHNDKEVFFIIFESEGLRTRKQIAENMLYESILLTEGPDRIIWRDICILDSSKVTIRSVTNDSHHKPSVKVLDSDWYISNDMSNVPNQAMREFIKIIHPELRIND